VEADITFDIGHTNETHVRGHRGRVWNVKILPENRTELDTGTASVYPVRIV